MKKQKTEKLNTNKGITLIALVITIIVMLILVAVTISMAVNGGLFEYAGKAVGDTNNALKAEGQLAEGGIEVGGVWYDSIDEYLVASGNKGNGGEEDNTQNPDPEPDTPSGDGITASTVQSNLTTYLGQPVNYGVTYTDASTYGEGRWEIFYADGEHIYIITRGHLASGALTTTGYNGTSDFTADSLSTKYPAVAEGLLNKTYDPTSVGSELKYTSTYDNMKATQYLLDSTVWATYKNELADWAIGGPTLELFVGSYNVYYPDKTVTLKTPTDFGYSGFASIPSETFLNHSTSYWLACPSNYDFTSLLYLSASYEYTGDDGYYGNYAFRPVVCLDSDVQLTWDSTNSEYTLSRAS